NRTVAKARELALLASSAGLTASGEGLNAQPAPSDMPLVVVNASASSLQGDSLDIDAGWWKQAVLCVDMMYSAKPTAFMQTALANRQSLEVVDGLGMLVNQAALAFEIWTGLKPDAHSTLARMRQTLTMKSHA
ncbi:MAG: shikimate dehydrogenase, partial [Limnobacter sp.]|nr:shikimate dehydrogenase [Limnobacter sp.]